MKATTRQDYFERMTTVLHYIESNIDRSLSLEELAEVACFSPYHFHRIFRSWVGESLCNYQRRLRVEQAAAELCYGEKKIFDIAFDAGFSSPEAFNRAFKKRFDLSPQQFRDAYTVVPAIHDKTLDMVKHHLFKQKERSMITVTIENQKSVQVASVRHVGPYLNAGIAWKKLCGWAGPKGLLSQGCEVLGICWDDPDICDESTIRFDAAVVVPEEIETEGDVVLQTIQEGEYAVTIHKGSLERLNDTYKCFFSEWLPGSCREIRNAPCLEKYLNDPMSVPPEEIQLKVCVPIV